MCSNMQRATCPQTVVQLSENCFLPKWKPTIATDSIKNNNNIFQQLASECFSLKTSYGHSEDGFVACTCG